jgi:RNA polymerase sigma factor (sigma-70 family)
MPALELSSLGESSAGRPSPELASPERSEVLRQFARGDLNAFETLFHRYQSEVFRWIVIIVRDPSLAEDLTIETFWRIHRAHARFDASRSFEAWARRIATHAALDYFKSSSHKFAKNTQTWDTADPQQDFPLQDLPQPAQPNPAIAQELRAKTAQAFHQLPPTLRVAATLALIEEQPYKEIAATLGVSEGAVKLRVFRALRLLRISLKQQGIEP